MDFKAIFSLLNASKVLKTFGDNSISINTFKQLINGYLGKRKPAEFTEAQKVALVNTIEKVAFHLLAFVKEFREKKLKEFEKKVDE